MQNVLTLTHQMTWDEVISGVATPTEAQHMANNTTGVPMFLRDVAASTNGLSSLAYANIVPSMMTWMANLIPATVNGDAPYDRVRLKRLRIIWEPAVHTAISGKILMYIERAGSNKLRAAESGTATVGGVESIPTAVDSANDILKLERTNNKILGPVYSPHVIEWAPQDPIDNMFSRSLSHFRSVETGGSSVVYDHQFVAAILYSDEDKPTTDDFNSVGGPKIAGSFRVQAIVELTGSG
jgi:hypothetical protein